MKSQFSSVAQSCSTLCHPMDCSTPGFPVHHQLPELMSIECHPTISSSVDPFSFCLQSVPPSGSFPMSQFFASDGQSIGILASASVLPMNIQDWFPLGLTDCLSLQSKGLWVFSNTRVHKDQWILNDTKWVFDTDTVNYFLSRISWWKFKRSWKCLYLTFSFICLTGSYSIHALSCVTLLCSLH